MNADTTFFLIIGLGVLLALVGLFISWYRDRQNNHRTVEYKGHTFTTKKVDKATGMYALPEGWFWSITKDNTDEDSSYHKAVVTLNSSEGVAEASESFYLDIYGKTEKSFKAEVVQKTRNIFIDLQYRNFYNVNLDKFFGNYPPKKL